ncbi:hypothetical protein M378DRAFT_649865 [Amanita muscaria Koide BX008]|uniref:Secreted protein n=1 Tax=Amanita muscaria (strain Koide BX008) TaxID=946122 RepID=A0A0C2X3K3_AMAMK|nr:hypothetical protein M378DRAFT_649865 [Amanita muscaria Koide BX008]
MRFFVAIVTYLSYVALVFGCESGAHHLKREVPSKCYNPIIDDCSFYPDCLETRYHCGPSGYPLGYGLKYCTAFIQNRGLLSQRGQQWMVDAMHCLQLALVPEATGESKTVQACDELKDYAFSTHPKCYVDNGFCTLPPTDWAGIVEIIGVSAVLSGLKQELQTAADCAGLYAYLLTTGTYRGLGNQYLYSV